jgi:hypothetical protein
VSDEASPFGRYLIPPVERSLNVILAAALGLYARWQLSPGQAGEALPSWDRAIILASITGLFTIAVLAWVIPATTVNENGIRRNYAVKRRLNWYDIADFTVRRRWGARRIYVQLRSGRTHSLDGVPLRTLPALHHQLEAGHARSGSWWLVGYSDASSTSSS